MVRKIMVGEGGKWWARDVGQQRQARIARIGRHEVSLRDTYHFRAARQQVGQEGTGCWASEAGSQYVPYDRSTVCGRLSVGRDVRAAQLPCAMQPRSLQEPSVAHNAHKPHVPADALGAVNLSRERELLEKAVASRRRCRPSADAAVLIPATGLIRPPPRLIHGKAEMEELELELQRKAGASLRGRELRGRCIGRTTGFGAPSEPCSGASATSAMPANTSAAVGALAGISTAACHAPKLARSFGTGGGPLTVMCHSDESAKSPSPTPEELSRRPLQQRTPLRRGQTESHSQFDERYDQHMDQQFACNQRAALLSKAQQRGTALAGILSPGGAQ